MLSINWSRVPPDVLAAFEPGRAREVHLVGPMRLVRAAGADNNPYGTWWFDEAALLGLQERFGRVPMGSAQRREATLGHLRAGLAVSIDWNTFSELWLMQIPHGEALPALAGPTREQPVFSPQHPLHNRAYLLRGGAHQYWIPVKNPFWVTRYA